MQTLTFTEVSQGWKTSTHDVKYDQHTCGGLCFNLKGPVTLGKRMGQLFFLTMRVPGAVVCAAEGTKERSILRGGASNTRPLS